MAFLRAFLSILLILAAVAAEAAEPLQLGEQKIKAGLLYNFLKYIDWPAGAPEASGPLVICLYGGDPLGGALKNLEGRSANQREIQLRPLAPGGDTQGCHMLYIHPGQRAAWPALRQALEGRRLLTVADHEGFALAGGMIEFRRRDDRIGVDMNLNALEAAHLSVQDRLLPLVTVVQTRRELAP